MAAGRRTGAAGSLAAAAIVLLGTTVWVFVAPPRPSGAPQHVQLRAGAALPPAVEAPETATNTWDWSAASILSMSAAFGLLLGVVMGPQPAVAGLSDRMKAGTGTVEVPEAKPAPPPP